MIFDELGLPRDNGASDRQDSARLAGILTLFDWPQKIDLREYGTPKEEFLYRDKITGHLSRQVSWKYLNAYVRHPAEYKYDFSRDQAICLIAGLSRQFPSDFWINAKYITGNDFLSPSVKGHIQRCKGLKASWWQDQWLKAEILISAKFSPLGEPNQILCMCVVAGPEWVKRYCKANPQWKRAIEIYWKESYRNEPELCDHMIQKIESILNKSSA